MPPKTQQVKGGLDYSNMIKRNKKGQFIKGSVSNWKEGISLQKDYEKQWLKRNPEKAILYSKTYRKKYPERIKKIREKYLLKHPKWWIEFWKKNKEKYNQKRRKTHRERNLTTGNMKYTGLIKRFYPIDNKCELCEKMLEKGLKYHHWDNDDLKKGSFVKGVWICNHCHNLVEALDSENFEQFFVKYLCIKEKINEASSNFKKIY